MDANQFLNWLHGAIPLTRAMQIDRLEFDQNRLSLSAPLEPNINDKGTGFAGATSGLATLAGWTLVTLWLKERGVEADVMVVKSELNYSAPVRSRFSAEARFSDLQQTAPFLERLSSRGRARIALEVEIADQDRSQLQLAGEYVAVLRERDQSQE